MADGKWQMARILDWDAFALPFDVCHLPSVAQMFMVK